MAQQNQIKRVIELGVAQVNPNFRDMNLALAALAQENARARVAAGTVTDLTDSSGGTDNGALVAVVTPTVAAVNNVTAMAPKAAFDTQIGLIEDAHRELLVKANEYIALIAPGSTIPDVDDMTLGAATDDIIAAITAALTGTTANDAGVEDATGIAQIVIARNNQASICAAINWVRVAQGLPPITDNSGGTFTKTQTAYPTDDAAATGTAAPNGANSLTDTSVDAALDALRDNIATMAAALTEANAPAIGPFVVATHNPRTRFATGDVTP